MKTKKLKIDKEEVEILLRFYELIEGEWGSPGTIEEYELQEKLKKYIKK